MVWGLIAEAYDRPHPAAVSERPGKAYFETVSGGAGGAIAKAIAQENRQALYAASTRAMSQLVRGALADAAENLAAPGEAQRHVQEARALYRSFADFVARADPAASKRIGLAWLDLTSSIGSEGVLGIGSLPADKETFERARRIISDYLVANFEPQRFSPRKQLTPLPETVVAKQGEVHIAPGCRPGRI